MNPRGLDVVIAGAGIGGLTAALQLAAIGCRVRVFESTPEIRELGVGINVQPHGVKALDRLGLGQTLADSGVAVDELIYFNKHGQEIWREPRGLAAGYRWPQCAINRGRLQGLLHRGTVERLGAAVVRAGHHLASFEQDERGVTVNFVDKRTGASLGAKRCDVLVAADGVHSTVRRHFYPQEGEPRFSGQLMYRGVSDWTPYLGGRSMFMAGHNLQKFVGYPMSGAAERAGRCELNFVAEKTIPPDTPMVREEYNRRADLAEILPWFEDWPFPWLDIPAVMRACKELYVFPKVDRDPIPRWSFGRVTLLGDAAHPMHPAGSNGATQAIVDAPALARAILAAPDPVAALAAYETERRAAVSALVSVNRNQMGPEKVMILAEQRAPDGFANVLDVLTREELETTSQNYRRLAGFDQAAMDAADPVLDARHSPPRRPGGAPTEGGNMIRFVIGAVLAAAALAAALPAAAQSSAIEQRLEKALRELGFPDGKLPALKPAFGNYVDTVQSGNQLFLSSAAPQRPDGQFVRGRVPDQVKVEDAMVAAKLACVRQVNRMKLALGDLGKVKRIVYVRGKTLAQEGFTDHTKITDACSAFLVEVFGDAGKHARTSEGLSSAPFGVTFEVDILVEVN